MFLTFIILSGQVFADSALNAPLKGYACTFSVPTGLFHFDCPEARLEHRDERQCRRTAPVETLKSVSGGEWTGRSDSLRSAQADAIKQCSDRYWNESHYNGFGRFGNRVGVYVPGLREQNFFEHCREYWKANPESMDCEEVTAPRLRQNEGNFVCRERIGYRCTAVIPSGAFKSCDHNEQIIDDRPLDGFALSAFDHTIKTAKSALVKQCMQPGLPRTIYYPRSFSFEPGSCPSQAGTTRYDYCRALIDDKTNVSCSAVGYEECLTSQ